MDRRRRLKLPMPRSLQRKLAAAQAAGAKVSATVNVSFDSQLGPHQSARVTFAVSG
jgi:hypothetical protein